MSAAWFVSGTDTGIGKTLVSCALLELLREHGVEQPRGFKPFESGVTPGATLDSEALRRAAGGHQSLDEVCLERFAAPLAPGVAAALEKRRSAYKRVLMHLRTFDGPRVVEGAGGLYVPLDGERTVLDLAVDVKLPLVLVARAGLGTLNHTLLSLQACALAKATVAGVVLVQSSTPADPSVPHNRAWLEKLAPGVPVYGPIPFQRKMPARLREAKAVLSPFVLRTVRAAAKRG